MWGSSLSDVRFRVEWLQRLANIFTQNSPGRKSSVADLQTREWSLQVEARPGACAVVILRLRELRAVRWPCADTLMSA